MGAFIFYLCWRYESCCFDIWTLLGKPHSMYFQTRWINFYLKNLANTISLERNLEEFFRESFSNHKNIYWKDQCRLFGFFKSHKIYILNRNYSVCSSVFPAEGSLKGNVRRWRMTRVISRSFPLPPRCVVVWCMHEGFQKIQFPILQSIF